MSAYLIHILIIICIYAILALSLNLLVGYSGLISVATGAFFGIGAYTTAILSTQNWNFFISILIGIVFTSLSSLIIGFVLSKFRGDFYVLGSLGFNVIVFSLMLNWENLTGGPLGINAIPRPTFLNINFYNNFNYFILCLIILFCVYYLCQFISNSAFGRALKGIREDEQALSIFGYNTTHYKLVVFVLAAGFASIAGSLFASYITYIDPLNFTVNESIFILSIIILGGLASLPGSIIGAVILNLLPEILRFFGFPAETAAQIRLMTYGLLLVVLMLYRPQGLVGEYRL